MPELLVDFIGDCRRLSTRDELVFGRDADLVIDDNPYLHRRLGLVFFRSGNWWLRNVGDRIALDVRDVESRSVLIVAPGREAALTFSNAVIRFEVGGAKYEVSVSNQAGSRYDSLPNDGVDDDDIDSATIGFQELPLTDDQKRLLVVLCEEPLRNPAEQLSIPTSKAAAKRLDWTVKAYGRRLDNLCDRLSRTGVRGLRGDTAGVVKDRRLVLAQHALVAQLVTRDDLRLLGPAAKAD